MSAEPARHLQAVGEVPDTSGLRVIDENGELVEKYDDILQGVSDQLAGAEHEVRAWRARYQNLRRDKAKEAREHGLFGKAKELFDHWRKVCNHPGSEFTPDRFWLLLPWLEKHGAELCRRAIDGAAFDCFTTEYKNGAPKRHDGLTLIFRDADHFEDFCNRAPRDWKAPERTELRERNPAAAEGQVAAQKPNRLF